MNEKVKNKMEGMASLRYGKKKRFIVDVREYTENLRNLGEFRVNMVM